MAAAKASGTRRTPRINFLRLFRISRLSTGFKLFTALSLALLPLAMIAFFATLQSSRTADLEKQAQMRIALNESSRKLSATIASDISAIRVAMEAIEVDPEDPSICMRLSSIMAAQGGSAAPFAIFGSGTQPVCAALDFSGTRPSAFGLRESSAPETELTEDHLNVTVPGSTSLQVGKLIYSRRTLANIASPGDFGHDFALTLIGDTGRLEIADLRHRPTLSGYETLATPVGITGLSLEMTLLRDPFSTAELVAILLPVLMWAAAAAIGWLVVDRVLIRPLRDLERQVSAYQPGTILDPHSDADSAEELRQLGETFHTITQMIASHEAALADGLEKQTKLTREVHHRVKNNLQVIASLINLHARSAESMAVSRAYASIQRRVDALSVVHRNHFAELEENHGVELRKLIGELAQNLRGSVPDGEIVPAISIDVIPCYASQDIAVPVAFLLTELIEIAMECMPGAPITINLQIGEGEIAQLGIISEAFVMCEALEARLNGRFGRILQGLSRQLRSPLDHDQQIGRFAIELPVKLLSTAY